METRSSVGGDLKCSNLQKERGRMGTHAWARKKDVRKNAVGLIPLPVGARWAGEFALWQVGGCALL